MSRIGKKPVLLVEGVNVDFQDDRLTVKGPLGSITKDIHPDVSLDINSERILVIDKFNDKFHRSLQGTIRSIVMNMVTGVTKGFIKELFIVGMGYKAEVKDENLNLMLGFSHPVFFKKTEGINFSVKGNNKITVEGIDKEKVGEIAAEIRAYRKPEPYKGKGIRYKDERVRRKAGKIAA